METKTRWFRRVESHDKFRVSDLHIKGGATLASADSMGVPVEYRDSAPSVSGLRTAILRDPSDDQQATSGMTPFG